MSEKKEVRELLEEEIKKEIEELGNFEQGSKEHTAAVENLAKLYRLKIEETKNDWEIDEKYNRRIMDQESSERDEQLKKTQSDEQRRERYFRWGIDVAGIVLPLMFYGTWMRKGFKFEETGTFTSTTFRGLFNCFKPGKK
jgi:hypothetical protein